MNSQSLNLKLTWEMNVGDSGEDSDPSNPLARALHRLLVVDGQPFNRLSQCFWAERPLLTSNVVNYLHWLGVFVLSDRNMLIFFPGLSSQQEHMHYYENQKLKWFQNFNVDHLTLESNYRRWHITSQGSANHTPWKVQTAELGGGRNLWFGMSISDSSSLRTVKKLTSIITNVPQSDKDRRVQVFQSARENAVDQIVEQHPDSLGVFPNGFYHISVIVGSAGFELYKGENHGFPIDSPFLSELLPRDLIQIPMRYHRVSLSEDIDLQISTARLPGTLKTPVTFTMVNDPNR